uniref:Gag-Pol polyprotein n=1 Tax=Tanacetum cinerariifolium TaxID=118510 RepID=A0A699HPJ9_TANCI|nr:Gag-Pol polyprotein [Tanacetum cinerariifolium]
MAAEFEIEKLNRNNLSLWKLKMKAILTTKDKCLAVIDERPAEVTDDSKWDEMDTNAITNLHLVLANGVLSSIEEKKTTKDIWEHLARLYVARSLHNKNEETLRSSHDGIYFSDRAHYLVFDDVATVILEKENRHNNMEDKKKNFKCYKCGKPGHFKKDYWGLNTSYPQGNVASTSEDAWVELDSGKKIECLRTDNGGEYTDDEFDTICRQEEIKRKCLFLGYADGVKGYCLWDPTAYKVVISRDFFFMKDKIQDNKEGDSTIGETTSIQMENEIQSNDSFEVVPQHELRREDEDVSSTVCISSGKFNVRDDLYKTRYCTCSRSSDLDGSKSTTWYVFTLSSRTISCVLKQQSVVAMSTTEAEYVAATQANKEVVWLKMLLEELGQKQEKILHFVTIRVPCILQGI